MTQEYISCNKCGSQTDAKGGFCGRCGASLRPRANSTGRLGLSGLADAIQATLRKQAPSERIELFKSLTETESDLLPDESAFAWAMRMRCHTEIAELSEAEQCVYCARESYARHLDLNQTEIDAYVRNDFSLSDNEAYKIRELEDFRINPWLGELFENGFALRVPLEHVVIGDTLDERRQNAASSWAYFGHDDDALRGFLAILYLRLEKHREAAAILDRVNSSADLRGSEIRGELQVRSLWPLVVAGQCHAKMGDYDQAMGRWQKCRSLELYCDENDGFCRDFGIFWIDKAKEELGNQNIAIPSLQNSKAAADHLASAWNWMLQAESWIGGMGLDQELIAKFNYSGNEFRNYVENASIALANVHKLDPFTRSKVTSADGVQVWVVPDFVVAEIWHMTGVIHLLMDQLDLAIKAFTQSVRTLSSLGSYLWLGIAHDVAGKVKEARDIYSYMNTHGRSLANPITEDDASCEQFIESARSLLAQSLF
jgi:tetratricopeptide (TPR) repeat protein